MRRSIPWLLSACVAAVVTVGCTREFDAADTAAPEFEIHDSPLMAVPVTLSKPVSPENDDYGFAFPVDLRFRGNQLVVLENQNSRLVVFDTAFTAVQTIGREGAGPGELRGVFHLDVWRGKYAVSEINNGRISVFLADGTFRWSIGVPDGSAQFAFRADGGLLVNAASPDHYLYAVDSAGLRRPFGERPAFLYPSAVQRERVPRGMGRELVATLNDDVYVFDVLLAGLLRFDASGRRRDLRVLPADLREALRQALQRVYGDFGAGGGRAYSVSVSDLTVSDDGRLLLLFPVVERTFGLLIDPSTFDAQRLEWPAWSEAARRGLGGGKGVLHGGRLYRVHGDEVTVFRLDPPR